MKTKHFIIIIVLVLMSVFLYLTKNKLGHVYYVLRNDFNYPELEMIEVQRSSIDVNYNERIWLHRVNDLTKLEYALENFSGVELDVMYDTTKNVIDIHYWPDELSKGLYLSDYISFIDTNKDIIIWLDFKNLHILNETQIGQAISHIKWVIEACNFPKNNLIIESPDPEKLQSFIKEGFICSYWIPHIKTNFLSSRDIEIWHKNISEEILSNNITLISFEVSMLPLVSRYFPNINHLVWGLNSNLKGILIDELH